MEDMPLMQNVGDNMLFKAFCALADGAVSPIHSSLKYFLDEYEEHVRLGRCPFEDRAWVGTAREAGAEATEGTERPPARRRRRARRPTCCRTCPRNARSWCRCRRCSSDPAAQDVTLTVDGKEVTVPTER